MAVDVRRARRDTPDCEHVLHFNNAGAALMPQPVLDATLGAVVRASVHYDNDEAEVERFCAAFAVLP